MGSTAIPYAGAGRPEVIGQPPLVLVVHVLPPFVVWEIPPAVAIYAMLSFVWSMAIRHVCRFGEFTSAVHVVPASTDLKIRLIPVSGTPAAYNTFESSLDMATVLTGPAGRVVIGVHVDPPEVVLYRPAVAATYSVPLMAGSALTVQSQSQN
jgi:hypothetical protein